MKSRKERDGRGRITEREGIENLVEVKFDLLMNYLSK